MILKCENEIALKAYIYWIGLNCYGLLGWQCEQAGQAGNESKGE